jgi:dephospho-CoA kinase
MSPRPKRIGLTGNIGSGKSTVASLLVEKGAALIDADALAKEASSDPEVLDQIAERLGSDLITDGQLDRAKTATRIFQDAFARQTLNQIIHPWVRRESEQRVLKLSQQENPPSIILMDIPLLYEGGLEKLVDAVIVVSAPLALRVARVQQRNGLSEAEIIARDKAQLPLEEKVARADIVIDNSGSLPQLEQRVSEVWQALLALPLAADA